MAGQPWDRSARIYRIKPLLTAEIMDIEIYPVFLRRLTCLSLNGARETHILSGMLERKGLPDTSRLAAGPAAGAATCFIV